jgi:hypothetical protein
MTVHVIWGISNCPITHHISRDTAPTYSCNTKVWGGNRLKTDKTEYLACSQLNIAICDCQNTKYGRQNLKTVITTLYRTNSNYMVLPLTVSNSNIWARTNHTCCNERVFLYFIYVDHSNKMNKWAMTDLILGCKFKCSCVCVCVYIHTVLASSTECYIRYY